MLRLASLLKVYLFIRALLTRTIFYSERSNRVTKIFNIELDYHFVLKCVMRHSPFVIALGWMFLGMLSFGYAIQITEKPLKDATDRMSHYHYFTCVWEAFITMSTVGYGDHYPRTNKGRVVMVLCAFYGVVNLSLIVVSVANTLQMSLKEEKSFQLICKMQIKHKMQKLAGCLIAKVAKFSLVKGRDPHRADKLLIEAQEHYDQFSKERDNYRLAANTVI